jgi:hypothetical protein
MAYQWKKDPKRGKGYYIARAPEDIIRTTLPLEPIVSAAQHAEVLRIVAAKRRGWQEGRHGQTAPRFLYRGFLYCGACHLPMYPWRTAPTKEFYQCRSHASWYRKKGPAPPCSNKSMLRRKLEVLIETRLSEKLLDSAFLTTVLEAHFRRRATNRLPDTDTLARERFEALEAKRRRVIDLYADGNITRLEKNERLRDLDRQHEALIEIPAAESPAVEDRVATVRAVVETLQGFTLAAPALKRQIIERVIPEIYVHRYVVEGVTLSLGSENPTGSTTDRFITTSPKSHDSRIYIPFETALV